MGFAAHLPHAVPLEGSCGKPTTVESLLRSRVARVDCSSRKEVDCSIRQEDRPTSQPPPPPPPLPPPAKAATAGYAPLAAAAPTAGYAPAAPAAAVPAARNAAAEYALAPPAAPAAAAAPAAEYAAAPPAAAAAAAPAAELELSKEYEVISQLLVSSAEDLCSPIVGDLSAGSHVTILCIGKRGRVKVRNTLGTVQGWVSSNSLGKSMLRRTNDIVGNNEISTPRLCKSSVSSLRVPSQASNASRVSRASRAVSSALTRLRGKKDRGLVLTKQLEIGDVVEAEDRVILREEESMSSLKILTLKGGSQVRIIAHGTTNPNRVKVSAEGTLKVGWVSILDQNLHQPLFGKRTDDIRID